MELTYCLKSCRYVIHPLLCLCVYLRSHTDTHKALDYESCWFLQVVGYKDSFFWPALCIYSAEAKLWVRGSCVLLALPWRGNLGVRKTFGEGGCCVHTPCSLSFPLLHSGTSDLWALDKGLSCFCQSPAHGRPAGIVRVGHGEDLWDCQVLSGNSGEGWISSSGFWGGGSATLGSLEEKAVSLWGVGWRLLVWGLLRYKTQIIVLIPFLKIFALLHQRVT